jgi:hypothetical protein
MSLFALDITVRASALVAAAALADFVLRRSASAATRHLLWTLTIGALLALPIASYVLPEWTVPIPIARPIAPRVTTTGTAASNAVVTPVVASRAILVSCLEGRRCGPDTAPAEAIRTVERATAIARRRLALCAVYAAGVILLLVRLVLGRSSSGGSRASRDVTDAAWRRLCDEAASNFACSGRCA